MTELRPLRSQLHPVEYVVANHVAFVAFIPPVEVGQVYTAVRGDNNVGEKVLSGVLTCESRSICLIAGDLLRDFLTGDWLSENRLVRYHALVAEGCCSKSAHGLAQFLPKHPFVDSSIVKILVEALSLFIRMKVQELEMRVPE